MYVIIDRFDPSMPFLFKNCAKHGPRLHFDNLCPGCMEDRYGRLDVGDLNSQPGSST